MSLQLRALGLVDQAGGDAAGPVFAQDGDGVFGSGGVGEGAKDRFDAGGQQARPYGQQRARGEAGAE
jgi:hypothetical protein